MSATVFLQVIEDFLRGIDPDEQFPKLHLSAKLGKLSGSVCMPVQNMLAGNWVSCMHVETSNCNMAGCVLRYRRLSAVKNSEAELGLN